jgi:hypothetical protein
MNKPAIDRRWPTRSERRGVLIRAQLIAAGILLATVAASTPGCSYAYEYKIHGVVRNAADGAPLDGVAVTLKLQPLTPPTKWVGARERNAGQSSSDPDGSFSLQTVIDDVEFDVTPRWVLSLTKKGYEETLVDISQQGEPKSGSPPYLIAVVAFMRPSPPGATPPAEGAVKKAKAR